MRVIAGLVAAPALILLACSSANEPAVPGGTPADAPAIGWSDEQAAIAQNGPAPGLDAQTLCGSTSATFLSDLQTGAPENASVQQQWADTAPGGRQVAVSGLVATTHLGPQDLPMNHLLGDDLSMDINVDQAFVPYIQTLGALPADHGPDQMHVEIASGFMPHVPTPPAPDTGQTWAEMADKNRTGFQPGFDLPNLEDRIIIQGRYIVDCGHADYSTELHPMSFVAFARSDAATTTARVYYNAFRDTELYNPDFTILGNTGDSSRLTAALTKKFPKYVADELVRLLAGETDQLRVFGLLDAIAVAPVDWTVCAPAGSSGTDLQLFYDFVAKTGITLELTADPSVGCVSVHSAIGDGYAPADIALRHCDLPWAYLDEIAGAAIGNPTLDVQQRLIDLVGASNADKLSADPINACGDALAGPAVSASPSGQSVRVDDTQPFPLYGVMTVGWTG